MRAFHTGGGDTLLEFGHAELNHFSVAFLIIAICSGVSWIRTLLDMGLGLLRVGDCTGYKIRPCEVPIRRAPCLIV